MAEKRFTVNLNLLKHELQNAVIQNLATAPASPKAGQLYYNTSTGENTLYMWNGTKWIDLGDIYVHFTGGANANLSLTGAQVLKDISVNAEGHVTAVTSRTLTNADIKALIIEDTVQNLNFTWSSDKIQGKFDAINTLISGALTYKGGYDAATNTPALDATPIAGIKTGWVYVVTVAGDFFTVPVEAGDMLIAEKDSPTLETDWTVVNKNVTAASETVSGTVELATQAETDAGTDDTRAITPLKLAQRLSAIQSAERYSQTIGDGVATAIAVTHNLNNTDVMVFVRTAGLAGQEIICEIEVTDANKVTCRFNTPPAASEYRVTILA